MSDFRKSASLKLEQCKEMMQPKDYKSFLKRITECKTDKTIEKILTQLEVYNPISTNVITLETIDTCEAISGVVEEIIESILNNVIDSVKVMSETVSNASTETTVVEVYEEEPQYEYDEVDDTPDIGTILEDEYIENYEEKAIINTSNGIVYSLTDHKIIFWKNKTKNGGAQEMMLKKKPENHVSIHTHTVKNGRMWGSCEPDRLLKLVSKNRNVFEILSTYPYKVMFDIDHGGMNMFETHFPSYTEKIKSIIVKYFPNADMAISGSYDPSKFSLHITLNNYIVKSKHDRDILKAVVTMMKREEDSFDLTTYSNNKLMKCINQSKCGDPHQRIQKIIENDDPKAHLITCFIDESKTIPFPDFGFETNVEIKRINTRERFDLSTIPDSMKSQLPVDIEHVVDYTPDTYLRLLPVSADPCHNHRYTHTVAKFYHDSGGSFENFWSWIVKKHIAKGNVLPDEYRRWQYTWSKMDTFKTVNIQTIHAIAATYYPELSRNYHFTQFMLTFRFGNTVKIDSLNTDLITEAERSAIFWAGMGSGKTYMSSKYLAQNPEKSFLWICPNRALVSNVYKRLLDDGIEVTNYLHVKNKQSLGTPKNLIICLNSLHYLKDRSKYDIVVIDEIETFLNKFVDNDFIGTANKVLIWVELLKFLNGSNKNIFLDAFITTKTTNFVNCLNGKSTIYEYIKLPEQRTVIVKQHFKGVCNEIITELKDGKKLLIFYALKSKCRGYPSMETLRDSIERETGKKGISINADKDDEELKQIEDVNTHWKDLNFVISNNKITVGVNYDEKDFDKCYMFVAPYNLARDVIQFSFRARTLRENIITLCYIGGNQKCTGWKSDTHCFNNCKIYEKLIDSVIDEFKSPLQLSFNLFSRYANYKTETDLSVVKKSTENYIKELFDNSSVTYKYDMIPDITHSRAREIESCINSQDATMHEKMQHAKYFFKMQFTNEAVDVMLPSFDGEPTSMIADAWDSHDQCLFKRFKTIIKDEKNLFNKIARYNNFREDQIIPELESQLKLNNELITEIFNEFKFRYLRPTSSHKMICKNLYNIYFGKTLISNDRDASKDELKDALYRTQKEIETQQILLNKKQKSRVLDFKTFANDQFSFMKKYFRDTDETNKTLYDICVIPTKKL